MRRHEKSVGIGIAFFIASCSILAAQDRRDAVVLPEQGLHTKAHFGTSPFEPPEKNDTTFVVDQSAGLDTGCTFRSGGPLIFRIKVDRVVGDSANIARLKANGLISATARLQMPAFDVDSDATIPSLNPERDRVLFNGNVVPTQYLSGTNNVWKLNSFNVPIDWVNFPPDPGPNNQVQGVDNTIQIDIDVTNDEEAWCTAIDWASLEIEAVRPVVMAHGIFSNGTVWNPVWVPQLANLGIFADNNLNMGNLDSIGNNAAKIGVAVQRARSRWGVDRVNLVSHSKGGLDSRHYAESGNTVDQLVQLGTPNAGSPLADVAQAGALVLLGPEATVLANALAGPAGVQLTQPYMAGYNLVHGSNPKVEYTALAGNYDPDCFILNPFCRPLERLLLAITGPGDTIVPITSVHSLSYTSNRAFASSGTNKDATHTSLEKSGAVFNATSDRVRRYGRPKVQPSPGAVSEPEFVRSTTVGGELNLGQTKSHQVPVDELGPAFFSLMYPEGTFSLALVSPTGQRIEPDDAATNPNIDYDEGEILGGRAAVFALTNAETGFWTVEVTALALSGASAGYAVNAWIEEPAVTFSGSVGEQFLHIGSNLELFATLKDGGAPAVGATVTARVLAPDGTTVDTQLADDGNGADALQGDGIYSGGLNSVSQSGYYRVAFMASGVSRAGAPCSREDFAIAPVSASSSAFTGTFRDFGRDTDSDGFFNEMVIEAEVNITMAKAYRVFATLEDSEGDTLEARTTVDLGVGLQKIELVFDGEELFQNRVNGPFKLARVVLVEEDDLEVLPVDQLLDAYSSFPYSFSSFEHGPIELTGGGSTVGVDLNANGLYDRLDVAVEVAVESSGIYNWSGQLIDRNGTELGFDSGSSFFAAGNNNLTFSFAGSPIGNNGVDGPYFVSSLLVFADTASLVANNAYATPFLLASAFEGGAPPTSLLLQGGRFLVEVQWKDFVGNSGGGKVPIVPSNGIGPVALRSGDSTVLQFFSPENWELLLKVLDARSINDRFWVFQAAATDVMFTTDVTDTSCGVTKRYTNPQGSAAPAVTDTDAFAGCANPLPPSCVPDIGTICLGDDGRFKVEVHWNDFVSNTGIGSQVEIQHAGPAVGADSGLFYFFDDNNWEMLVKVLNGCSINNRFWVFSAATTNVEYTLTVTDTETGFSKEFFNPLGNSADAVTDINAFATCP